MQPEGRRYMFYRPWRTDELKLNAEKLPDPTKDVEAFVIDMNALIEIYEPSSSEIAAMLRYKLGVRPCGAKPCGFSG